MAYTVQLREFQIKELINGYCECVYIRKVNYMKFFWTVLGILPDSFLSIVKKYSSSRLRNKVREALGASYIDIPEKIVETSDGRKFHIGPDPMYWAIYHGIDYEPEATYLATSILRETDTVLDIGANFGWFSTIFAQKVNGQGKVIAFEPVPSTYQKLMENLELNSLDNMVDTHNIALGDKNGKISMHLFSDKGHGFSSISSLGENEFDIVESDIVKLDDFIKTNQLTHVDFIKCDVEGAELSVLQGAAELLGSEESPIILIELNDETSNACGFSSQDIWQFLSSLGYDGFYSIVSQNKVRRLNDISDFEALGANGQISKTAVPHLAICSKGNQLMERAATSGVEVV